MITLQFFNFFDEQLKLRILPPYLNHLSLIFQFYFFYLLSLALPPFVVHWLLSLAHPLSLAHAQALSHVGGLEPRLLLQRA